MTSSQQELPDKPASHYLILIASRARINLDGTADQLLQRIMSEIDSLRDQANNLEEQADITNYKLRQLHHSNEELHYTVKELTDEKYQLEDQNHRLSAELRRIQDKNSSLHQQLCRGRGV